MSSDRYSETPPRMPQPTMARLPRSRPRAPYQRVQSYGPCPESGLSSSQHAVPAGGSGSRGGPTLGFGY